LRTPGVQMVAKPNVTISHVEELFADKLGQLWSPAKVTLSWPAAEGLRAPAVVIDVIAPARAQMTIEELRQAHLQAARDVVSAALLSIEEPVTAGARPVATAGRKGAS
jgi:hypothetical protein